MSTSSSGHPLNPKSDKTSGESQSSSVDLLRILAKALDDASGVFAVGVADLREQLGPIWGELAAGLGARDFSRKLDAVSSQIDRADWMNRDLSPLHRQTIQQIVQDALQNQSASKNDDTYLFVQLENIEKNLKRSIDQALSKIADSPKAPEGKPSSSVRTKGTIDPSPSNSSSPSEESIQLKKAREDIEALKRKSENERILHQNDLGQCRDDLDQCRDELDRWRQIALGEELYGDASCQESCNEFLNDALGGQQAAVSLLGHWLTFRAVPPDRLPLLMKQIGEIYYAWRLNHHPTSADEDPLEQALCRLINARCEKASVRNKVETIRQNIRFDAARHEAEGGLGGTTVVTVRGWLVLKADNSVLYRAKVSAR